MVAAGDLELASDRLREIAALAKAARTPLRAARARLRLGGSSGTGGTIGRGAPRAAALAPALRGGSAATAAGRARRASADAEAGGSRRRMRRAARALPDAAAAVRLVTVAHGEERDADAVRRVLESVADAAQTSRIDLCSVDAGPVSTIMSVGRGLPTRLGDRVLDAGIVLGPEATDPGHELGVPARRGNRVAAAIVARWPADRTPPSGARELLEIAAAVVCPRLEAMLAAARASAQSGHISP